MSTPRLLTIPEVAHLLGCSRGSVYALIARGDLEVADIGTGRRSRTRVLEDALTAYVNARRRRAA